MSRDLEALVPGSHVLHRPPDGHPERPERIDLLLRGLARAGVGVSVSRPSVRPREALYRVHDPGYVEYIERVSRREWYIDGDTYVTRHTFAAALEAVSAAIEAAERVVSGREVVAALTRPPGHHVGRRGRALGASTQGFCIFNNAAHAAALLEDSGLRPVVVIDIDVHHGNGTQEVFWEDPGVVHIDIHDSSIYPGTGWYTDIGSGEGAGTKINVPLPPGSGDREYVYVWREVVEPLVYYFRPGALVVSAGFDAHEGERMGFVKISGNVYRWLGHRLSRFLREIPGLRGLVVVLEGGYGPGLYEGAPEMFLGLLGHGAPVVSLDSSGVRRDVVEIVSSLKKVLGGYHRAYV